MKTNLANVLIEFFARFFFTLYLMFARLGAASRALLNIEGFRGCIFGLLFVCLYYFSVLCRFQSYKLELSDSLLGDVVEKSIVEISSGLDGVSRKNLELVIELHDGSTFWNVLQSLNVSKNQVHELSRDISNFTNINRLLPGQRLTISLDCVTKYDNDNEANQVILPVQKIANVQCFVNYLSLITGDDKIITAQLINDSKFLITSENIDKRVKIKIVRGSIENSLYNDAVSLGVSPSVIYQVLQEYSFDIDFQRDVKRNDKFIFVFEEIFDSSDTKMRDGNLLFSSLTLKRKSFDLYRFKGDFYNASGMSIKKAMLRTPIDGARIASKFGSRKHPILGYTRFHRGIDFAAPTGTPIYAASNGIIEYIAYNGGAGNMITIKHNNGYKTRYFHMKSFRKGLKLGKKVQQRDVIGYVGTTGMSTGPHLHFEVMLNNKQVNPALQRFASTKKLDHDKLNEFLVEVQKINEILRQ